MKELQPYSNPRTKAFSIKLFRGLPRKSLSGLGLAIEPESRTYRTEVYLIRYASYPARYSRGEMQ